MLKQVINILYPIECIGCGRYGEWLCNDCISSITDFSYHNQLLKKAIHIYKYKFVKDLARPLGKLMVKKVENEHLNINQYDIIVPIPLHIKRLKWRGYNQSELLANIVGNYFHKPVLNALLKIKNTKPQMSLNKKQRKENLKDCFMCKMPKYIKNKNILLIDDVQTTGSTLNEAKKVLLKNSAKSVFTLTLAKT